MTRRTALQWLRATLRSCLTGAENRGDSEEAAHLDQRILHVERLLALNPEYCQGEKSVDENKKLREIINGLAARVAAQSELLSRRAEKKGRLQTENGAKSIGP